jgi:HEAT repeat protein
VDVAHQTELLERAVDAARHVSAQDDYDAVFAPLVEVADDAPEAIEAALARLGSDDAVIRATACDLVGLICERNEAPREGAVQPLLHLVASELDEDVLWSAARALGAAASSLALPALLALAHHPDADVRTQVAVAIPVCTDDDVDLPAVAALIELTNDRDADVRNWATFGLGRQLATDSQGVRDALWARVADESQDVREEAVAGLARRRDQRSLPLVAGLLESGDVPSWLFDAAASLADSSLAPALRDYDQADDLVRRALSQCDAEQRAERELNIAALIDETQRLLDLESPGSVVSAWCDRLDIDVLVSVHMDGDERLGSADHMLAVAGGEPAAAARRWVNLVTSGEKQTRE